MQYKILVTDMMSGNDWMTDRVYDDKWVASRHKANMAKANEGKFYVYQIVECKYILSRM